MTGHERRRSLSSSSSSSSSSDEGGHASRKHSKKDKKRKNKEHPARRLAGQLLPNSAGAPSTDYRPGPHPPSYSPFTTTSTTAATMSGPGFPSGPLYPYGVDNKQVSMPEHPTFQPPEGPPPSYPAHSPGFPSPAHDGGSEPHDRALSSPGFPQSPSAHQGGGAPPPSGFRVPLTTSAPFPGRAQTGAPVGMDLDGRSEIFVGSALFERSVHPCKIVPALDPPCRVPYAGTEFEHRGRFDLLPFDPNTMEWVPTGQGRLPQGRRLVEGGYEEHGGKLYHALAQISGVNVPGKTGEHLGGCNVAFGGAEHVIRENYQVLCWR